MDGTILGALAHRAYQEEILKGKKVPLGTAEAFGAVQQIRNLQCHARFNVDLQLSKC